MCLCAFVRVLPAAGSRGRLSELTDSPAQPVSAAAQPSAPPAAHATDSAPVFSPSGSTHDSIPLFVFNFLK